MNKSDLSVTNLAKKIVDNLINNSKELNLIIKKGPLNCTIIDAGIEAKGGKEAGKLIAEKISGFADSFNFFESIGHITIPGGDFLRRPIYASAIGYYKLRDLL